MIHVKLTIYIDVMARLRWLGSVLSFVDCLLLGSLALRFYGDLFIFFWFWNFCTFGGTRGGWDFSAINFPKCGRGFWAILIGKTRTRFTWTETKSELVFKNIYWKLNMMYRSRVYIKKKIMIINTCCTESWKKQTVMGPCLSMGHNTVFVQATKIFIFITVFLCCFT